MTRRVSESYAETGDIRLTMCETRLTFDVVWECLGYGDEMYCMVTED
jgi:hypothetical protein